MTDVDAGGGDRLALAVLTQYRMATTEQMHRVIAPDVRREQTRRRLAKLRDEGLIDRITLPRAGRLRVWFPTSYGVQIASEWPELRGRKPPKTVSDPTAARLRVGHTLTVTETALAFLEDARRRGELCRPLDWIPEVYHPLGSGEAVIPDALMYYRSGPEDGDWSLLRAFVEVDRATMGPERLAAKLTAYARLHDYAPTSPGQRRPAFGQEPPREAWRRHYPLFPRLLFVLDDTGPAGVTTRIRALHATATKPAPMLFLRTVPVLAAALADLRTHGPSQPVWRPVQDPDRAVAWSWSPHEETARAAAATHQPPCGGCAEPDHGADHTPATPTMWPPKAPTPRPWGRP
ncbi:replication-relaxation family protein [Streptomyces sp. NPDC047043]|uniref:replication-relaxation family protein n=1 Tax=Streptomyces sp. NPDC047043 TaxID=3154497 RepID=UPI0033D58A84